MVDKTSAGSKPQKWNKKKIASKGSGQSSSMSYLIWIIPIVAIVIFVVLSYLWFTMGPDEAILGATQEQWKLGTIFIFMILIVVLILVHPSGKSIVEERPSQKKSTTKQPEMIADEPSPVKDVIIEATEPEKYDGIVAAEKPAVGAGAFKEAEAVGEPVKAKPDLEIADAEIIAPPAKKVTPNVLEYPKKIEGGIYGDTFITVKEGVTLKLRTLVVEEVYLA